MVKGSVSSADKAPNSGSKRSLLETFHDEVDDTLLKDPDMVVEVSGPSTDYTRGSVPFDDFYKRCFIIEEMTEVVDAKIKTDDPNVTVIKKVFNAMVVNPLGERRVGTVWNQNATRVYKHLKANRKNEHDVFMFPTPASLTTPGDENFISEDPASFLQFVFADATVSQAAFHGVEKAFALNTTVPNRHSPGFIVHPNALPSVMDWPTTPKFKVKGKFLKHPSEWGADTKRVVPVFDYDYETVTPIKKFKF